MAASFSSSSPSDNCAFDVFLSFRGEDVRVKFISHFLKELNRKFITFRDNEIEKGKPIGPELLNAIKGSRIFIVAFSKNFVNSSWCLNELVEIMKCNKEMGKFVIPIFYDVDPSHIKKLTHSFGEIFDATCKGRTEDEILRWRQALTNAATIAGEDSRTWSDEAKMVEKIVNDVSNKLNSKKSSDFDNCVGIEDHMNKINSLLEWESEQVIVVGIWGPSGVGKTTIGRALFSEISCQFQGSIFIDKTKETYTRAYSADYNAKLHLQQQFLSELLNQKDLKIDNLDAVKERLGCQRVLVAFDDVNDQLLLKALVGEPTWFGSGSRIVVISKDRELLKDHGIGSHCIYEVHLPSQEQSFQMFCKCAFGQDSPHDGFMELAIEAVNFTGNLPLALNILGSSLKGKSKEEWSERMPKLRNRMSGEIYKTLRDSYNRLQEEDKAIFRHIACLFNHKPCDYMTRLLEDSNLGVEAGLVTLAERCLIHISEDKIIRMHDFLQDMGREIVRQSYIQEPGERQFLMNAKEICDVLVDETVSNRVFGISLNLSEMEDTLHISENAFRTMKNLRFLSIHGVLREDKEVTLELQKGVDHMWRQLRLLEWWGCSMKCMPCNFSAENLVELTMPDSHLEKLWEGAVLLKSLKKMDLRRSKKLKEFPDLSKATKLEELYLEDCWSLVKVIPSSIQNLNRLRKLDMKRCKNLLGLPTENLQGLPLNLESLIILNLSGCSRLTSFPQISRNISSLFLDETEIEQVPQGIEDISGLNYLLMNGCSNLTYISPNISKLKHLEVLFCSSSDSLIRKSSYEPPSAVTDNIQTQLPDAPSSSNWKNDLFISFLGSDVRQVFLSHLYKALSVKGITIYSDHSITRDEYPDSKHVNGIRESRIAIVVLSDNYVSSRWCLDELVEIIKCAEEIGQKVIPIFYGVDPFHIRNHILNLGKTFDKYTVDKQQKWRQALTVVNQLQGYHSQDWDSEAEMIQKMADDIYFGLNFTEKLSDLINLLPRFGNNLDQEIKKKLTVSYDSLNGKEKALFRHIACFLNNETYENVMRLLEYSDLDVGFSLKTLFEKSLIQISEERVIRMHHLLQKLGREKVLAPFIHQPAKRQFLMDTKKACDVLIDQSGNENVLGISFKVSEMEETPEKGGRFKELKKLHFMRMYKERLYGKEIKVHLVRDLHFLLHRLTNI